MKRLSTNLSNLKFTPFYLVSALPFTIMYRLSDAMAFMLYHVFKYRRKVVSQNLDKAFIGQDNEKIARSYYRHMCDIFFETIKCLTVSRRRILSKIDLTDADLLDEMYKNGKNIIIYAAHQGNWEWLVTLPLLTKYKVNAVYQPLSSPYFDSLLKTIRSRFGVNCIPSNKAHRSIAKSRYNKQPEIFIIIGDQCPRPKSTYHWTQFLNQETAFYSGSARLALKFDQTILYSFIEKVKRGKYSIHLQKIEEQTIEDISESYSNYLEKSIVQSPSTWLWSHRRWKLKREDNKALSQAG